MNGFPDAVGASNVRRHHRHSLGDLVSTALATDSGVSAIFYAGIRLALCTHQMLASCRVQRVGLKGWLRRTTVAELSNCSFVSSRIKQIYFQRFCFFNSIHLFNYPYISSS